MHTPHTNTPLYQNNILSLDSEGMSRLRRIMFLFIIASLFLAFTTHNAIPSVSFTASNQLKYWFENVKDHMLEAIYPNYLPLIKMILSFSLYIIQQISWIKYQVLQSCQSRLLLRFQ